MGVLDMLFSFVKSKSNSISRATGKSQKEIESAIEKGKSLIPDIKNSKDGGVSILKSMGMNRNDLRNMYHRFGKYADKVPFLGKDAIDNLYNNLDRAMGENPINNNAKKSSNFNKSKYYKK